MVVESAGSSCCAVLVTGAGSEDANGLYIATDRVWHGTSVFENDRRCIISREPHKSQKTGVTSYGWIIGQDKKPIYAVQSEEATPPSSGWKKFTGDLPIPQVQGMDSVQSAATAAASAMKEQGNALFAARSYKEAEAKWSRALGILDKHGEEGQVQVALYANRAESNLRLERWEEALEDAREALKRKPTHDKALLRAAVALRELKRCSEAQQMVQRCLDCDPRHTEAKQLLRDLDQLVEGERRQTPSRAQAAREKLRESVAQKAGDVDLSSIPRAFDTKDINNKKGLQAFSGYSKIRSSSDDGQVPISELPYHKMGLPDSQVELMDNFFRELRTSKKQQAMSQKKEEAEYALVKCEYKERAIEDKALGKTNPSDNMLQVYKENREQTQAMKDEAPLPSLMVSSGINKAPVLATEKMKLSAPDKAEIDDFFAPFKPKAPCTHPDGRTTLEKVLDAEEASEKEEADRRTLEELQKLKTTRRGEPTRFEQAAGELYCWWALPAGVAGKDVKVQASQGGCWLTVEVKGVMLFDRQLFHHIRGDDILWSVDAGELSLTLTKGERSKLWDQLGIVGEVQRDKSGKVVEGSIPEPMSGKDRLEKFRQMVAGDDGHETRYEDLDDNGKRLVDAMRRYEHARATGDQNALALAEHDLEEMGRLVI